jgi:hypothetical protein
MATLLDFNCSCFFILESTFQLDFVEGIQTNCGESIIQKVGVYEPI